MSNLDDRRRLYLQRFSNDAEAKFRLEARRNSLLAAWVSDTIGQDDPVAREEYRHSVIEADLEIAGVDDVVIKVHADLVKHGIEISREELRDKIEQFDLEAIDSFLNE